MSLTGKYLDKFMSRIVRSEGCWEWDGAHTTAGYPETWDGERPLYAHRVAYEMWVGPIPEGYEVDHLVCDNPGCLRPDHLRAVTPWENNRRSRSMGARHARTTHCPRGHRYDTANTHIYVKPTGRSARVCRACWKLKNDAKPRKGRRPLTTHCPHGHPMDEQNTYVYVKKDGSTSRQCKACALIRQRKSTKT
jgi:hypothetical protein